MTRGRRRSVLGALAAVSVVGLAGCGGDSAHAFVGYTTDTAVAVDEVALPDLSRDGEPFALRAEPDGLLLVYFGFTNCPDYCPTTLSATARIIDELGDDGGRISVAMVSVDPERDADTIVAYVDSFVPGAHALLTDDLSQVARVAQPFGADFAPAEASGNVPHTRLLYAVDDEGELLISWTDEMVAEADLTADVRALLDR